MKNKSINKKNAGKRLMFFSKFSKNKNSNWLEKLLIFFGIKDEGPIGRFR